VQRFPHHKSLQRSCTLLGALSFLTVVVPPPQKEASDPQLTTATPAMWATPARRGSHAGPATDTRPASHTRPASKASPACHARLPARPGAKQTRQTSRSRGKPGQADWPREASKQREGVGPRSPILYIRRKTCRGQVPAIRHPHTCPVATQAPSRLGFIHRSYTYKNRTS
jgi:hypothetical protein